METGDQFTGHSFMSYITRLSSKISKYKQDNYTELISFRRRMWPDHPSHLDELHWNWQFQDNPNNPTPSPEIWIFKDDGQILGHQAAIPVLLKVGDAYYRSSWAIDLIVDPRFHNKGIGYLLTRELNKSTAVTMALGISDAAYSMYKKNGWIDMGHVPTFFKILNAKPLVKKRLRFPVVSGILSILINICLKLRDALLIKKVGNHVQIDQIDHFDKHFDELWERVSDRFSLIARRDTKYLNWKYVYQPGTNHTIFQMRQGDEISGYIVLKIRHEDNKSVGYIIDFLEAQEQLTPLMKKAVHYFRKEKVNIIWCCVLNKRIEALMKKFGFFRREFNRLMIKVNNPKLELKVPRKKDDWFITYGDSDGNRPWNN